MFFFTVSSSLNNLRYYTRNSLRWKGSIFLKHLYFLTRGPLHWALTRNNILSLEQSYYQVQVTAIQTEHEYYTNSEQYFFWVPKTGIYHFINIEHTHLLAYIYTLSSIDLRNINTVMDPVFEVSRNEKGNNHVPPNRRFGTDILCPQSPLT